MSKIFFGVDPGDTGALAALYPFEGSGNVRIWDAPLKDAGKGKSVLSEDGMFEIVSEALRDQDGDATCFIEWAQSSPNMGVTSAFNYGVGFGMWLGAFAAFEVPRIRVRPQEWMSLTFLGRETRSKKLSLRIARERFPSLTDQLSLAKHHGRAEALLIAAFGRRIAK